ncbi:hypothetical protein L873DRAFT_785375 [Choiromyces venosus 120613-1]|uniref:Uncharacterized protein n=1 Tax=Choiromyces venosus 120613-1 TaxID=1336337 RepID=A0A3N4KHK2_9PEZI|nr:hypothetical protein L873DRAFT_785375 [Choiromyces venosus 120613-1]
MTRTKRFDPSLEECRSRELIHLRRARDPLGIVNGDLPSLVVDNVVVKVDLSGRAIREVDDARKGFARLPELIGKHVDGTFARTGIARALHADCTIDSHDLLLESFGLGLGLGQTVHLTFCPLWSTVEQADETSLVPSGGEVDDMWEDVAVIPDDLGQRGQEPDPGCGRDDPIDSWMLVRVSGTKNGEGEIVVRSVGRPNGHAVGVHFLGLLGRTNGCETGGSARHFELS